MSDGDAPDGESGVTLVPALSNFTLWSTGGKGLFFLCALWGSMYAGKALSLIWPPVENMLPLFLGLAFVAMLVLQVGSQVEIGSDGLRHRWLGRSRFVRWSDVTRIERWVNDSGAYVGLRLLVKDGKPLRISVARENAPAEADALLERAQAAFAKYQRGNVDERLTPLERGTREGVEWVRHLRAVGAGGGADARTNHVGADALLRVVEDSGQPALARASAVVAAVSQLSPDEIERVRVIASSTVDDSLRSAMERALDPEVEEQAVAEALTALDSDERRVR